MNRPHSNIAAPWQDRADELAAWTGTRLVNRRDVWGAYLPIERRVAKTQVDAAERVETAVTAPPVCQRGQVLLTDAVIARHYAGHDAGHLIGLHSTSADGTCLWIGIDLDQHGSDEDQADSNETAASDWNYRFEQWGFHPLLTESNGRGGFHLRVLFREAVAADLAYRFAQHVIGDFADFGLDRAPETFPKQPRAGAGTSKRFGNWLRLPGRHHKLDHWTRVYDRQGGWLDGDAAIDQIVRRQGDDPALLIAHVPPSNEAGCITSEPTRSERKPRPARADDLDRARACVEKLSARRADDYDDWLKVGMALHGVDDGPESLATWDAMSRRSHKYTDGACAVKWKTFTRDPGGLGLGSLIKWSQQDSGFLPPPASTRQAAPDPTERRDEPGDQPTAKTSILIDSEEHRVIDQTIEALAADESIYQRGGSLVRVSRECRPDGSAGLPTISLLPQANLRDRMTRWIDFSRQIRHGDATVLTPAHPTAWLVAGVDARGEWPGIRPLAAISNVPVLRADGTLCQTPGYDRRTGVLYEPSGVFPPVPDDVTRDDAVTAVAQLLEVVQDFRFERDVHRSAWLAALLTTLARSAFNGPAPLFIMDANVRGAGKTLLVQAIAGIATGDEVPASSYVHDPDEMRKQITSLALKGEPIICLDNVVGAFGNAALDRALTSSRWRDRILGRSQEVDLPLRAIWFATGNNMMLAADTPRRVLHIRLDVKDEAPEERGSFKHPELLTWIYAERARLFTAALTILRAYCRAAKPVQSLPNFGTFEEWSHLVRGALVWAGQPDPCAGRAGLVKRADTGKEALRQLLQAWHAMDNGDGIVVSELLDRLYDAPMPRDTASVEMRAAINNLVRCRPGDRPEARRVAAKLRHYRRQFIGPVCLDNPDGELRRNAAVWRLCTA